MKLATTFLALATIALSAAPTNAATLLISADSGPVKACLARAQAARAAAIATGTPRHVADKIWNDAVRRCKAQASLSDGGTIALSVPRDRGSEAPKTAPKGPKLPIK